MKICHTSDTHGTFNTLVGDFDIVIHSGDLLPNTQRRPRRLGPESLFQRDWVREHAEDFKNWIGNKPFLFSAGNHDYAEPCTELMDLGIDAVNITNRLVEIDGIKIYGFPYVPYIGVWNWELVGKDMTSKVNELVGIINTNKVDILVAHCPPRGIVDLNQYGENIGNSIMLDALNNQIQHIPKLYLTGHCHKRYDLHTLSINQSNMIISNAATTQRILEI